MLRKTQKVMRFRIFIQIVNVSICTTGKELMTLYLSNINAFFTKTKREKAV